ncbi:WG repeat-containing protein [Polaromonas sp. DSP2-3-2b2]
MMLIREAMQILTRWTKAIASSMDAIESSMHSKNTALFKPVAIAVLTVALFGLTACGSTGPKYRNVRSFSEGLAPVQAQTGRWGFINERQEWVIAPRFEDAKEFQGGKAAVRQNSKWGFINKRGEWL